MELRILKTDGWITEDNKLTDKAHNFLNNIETTFMIKGKKQKKAVLGPEASELIAQYREMFPKGNLPSGVPGRVHVRELETKFAWFFTNYNYDWETVLAATKKYIEEYEPKNFMYMKNSAFFISKQDTSKVITSVLATYCDKILDGDEIEQNIEQINIV